MKPIIEDEASDDEPIGKSYSDTDMEGNGGEDQDCNSENTESENEDLSADFGNCIDLSREHKVLIYMSDSESDDEGGNDMFVDDDMCGVNFRRKVFVMKSRMMLLLKPMKKWNSHLENLKSMRMYAK